MIRVDSSTAIEVVLSAKVTANQLPLVSSYADANPNATITYQQGFGALTTFDTNAVQIVPAAPAGAMRSADCLTIINSDTASATVTVRTNGTGGVTTIWKGTLAVGDQLTYTHAYGWKVLDTNGQQKTTLTAAPHNLLDGTVDQDTTISTVVRGDTIIGNSTPKWTRLAIGGANTALTSNGTDPSWGSITEAMQSLADNTTANVSSTAHGYAPKSPAAATQFLNGAATPAYAQVKDSDLSVSDVTTNNVSTSAHGFAPKSPNDATKFLDGTGNYSVPVGTKPLLGHYNVLMTNNGVTPNTKIDIKPAPFDPAGQFEVIVEDSSSPPATQKLRQSATITINFGTTGANGLDTGTQAASTWYYIYVIAKSDGTTAGLGSTSATAPTMPSGYTYKCLIGAIRSNGSTQFQKTTQIGKVVSVPQTAVFTATTGVTSFTTQSISSAVPPIASAAIGLAGVDSGGSVNSGMAVAGDANGIGEANITSGAVTNTLDGYFTCGQWRVIMAAAQNVFWKAATTTASNYRMDITGWEYA